MRNTCFCFLYFAALSTAEQGQFFLSCMLGKLLVSLVTSQKRLEGDQWTVCVKEIEGAYLIKNHRNSLLFGYYKIRFRCLELNLFSHCFDLKDLNLNKRFKLLRKDFLYT